MRRVRYSVAASLDGYIAGPDGEFDWIPEDPTVDFAAMFARVDTLIMGRSTYQATRQMGPAPWMSSMRVYVFSSTLPQQGVEPRSDDQEKRTRKSGNPKAGDQNDDQVEIISSDPATFVAALRLEPGDGEIWLFGGGKLFATLLAAGQVDAVEVTVAPVLLGGGIPLLAPGAPGTKLKLTGSHVYPSGMVSLRYETNR